MVLDLGRARAVLFDLDDTLVDWRSAEAAAIAHLARKHFAPRGIVHGTVVSAYAQIMARNMASWKKDRIWWYIHDRLQMLSEDLGTRDDLTGNQLAVDFTDQAASSLALLPGALDALRAARRPDRRTALLTNGKVQVQSPKVERFRLHKEVDFVGITEQLGVWKPDVGAFEKVLEAVGVDAKDAVMVGDSFDFDIVPAKSLGMQTVWVGGTASPQADLVVPGPHGLVGALRA